MIYTILNKATRYFKIDLSAPRFDHRWVIFILKCAELLPTVLTKDYLIFSEPEPFLLDKELTKDYQAWEERRDKFEPIFIYPSKKAFETLCFMVNHPSQVYTIEQCLEIIDRLKLNPNSPWYIDNFNEIMES